MPKKLTDYGATTRVRPAASMVTKIARLLPGLTRREWGEIAVAAARRAGLPEPDVASLRRDLEAEFALTRAP